MSTVASLREDRNKPVVAFSRFLKLRQRYRGRVFLLFEGDDAKYYMPRIKNRIQSDRFVHMDCGGKEAVLYIFSLWLQATDDLREENLFGFVDHDYLGLPESSVVDDRLYVTPFYSIENFYCSPEVLERILTIEFKIDLADEVDFDDFCKCYNLYRDLLSQFLDCMHPLNRWLYARRVIEEQQRDNRKDRLKLDNYTAANFVGVKLSGVSSKYDPDKLDEIFRVAERTTEEALERADAYFDRSSFRETHRGKFMLEFIVGFLCQLKAAVCGEKTRGTLVSRRWKCSLSLSGNALSDLSGYADTPACLQQMIERIADSIEGS